MKRRIGQFLLISCLVAGISVSTKIGYGTEVRSADTTSTIGFTGKYEPIGTPKPTPPAGIITPPSGSGPSGSLPKTSDQNQWFLSALGALLLTVSVVGWGKQKKKAR